MNKESSTPQKVLLTFAHPDDEAFGPGGTIALWASLGAHIELLCATKGESGGDDTTPDIHTTRAQELLNSAAILGIKHVEFLGFHDGRIGNNDLQALEHAITQKIHDFKPDTILTFNLNGVSGHLDHTAVASATTQAFKKTNIAEKLYYYTEKKKLTDKITDYFVYFPPGISEDEADEVIDISPIYATRLKAMHCHKSQQSDIEWLLNLEKNIPQSEYFVIRKKVNN